jgi:hypothetical protein
MSLYSVIALVTFLASRVSSTDLYDIVSTLPQVWALGLGLRP